MLPRVAEPSSRHDATIVITTKNRKDELRVALRSALDQSMPVEVLVIDDGSTDGTSQMVRTEFPTVRLERSEESRGLIVQRNRAAQMIKTPILISIDDDALFPSRETVRQTLEDFEGPRVGAVAIPYVDVTYSNVVRQTAPDPQGTFVTAAYRGTAHALRVDVFRRLGGYKEFFVHQGEESEYAIRLLQAGYVIRLGRADPIHHIEAACRSFTRMHYYGARNHLLYAWYNVPGLCLPVHLVATSLNCLRWGLKKGYTLAAARGLWHGIVAIGKMRSARCPVSMRAYRLMRRLIKRGPLVLQDIEEKLLPLTPE